jgi:hypothetical protein
MTGPGWRELGDLALGAAFRAGESAAEAVEQLRAAPARALQPPENGLLGKAGEVRDRAGQLRGRARDRAAELEVRLDALRRRGAAERQRGRGALDRAVDTVMTAIATSPLVDRIVTVQVDRVLGMLEREPDRIRVLVRGQRDSVVGEMVGRVRAGAAAGDAVVDRLTLRMSRPGDAADTDLTGHDRL